MKAITICQPYAELIMLGQKRVENRVWRIDYRGPLLIHAGKSRTWLDSYKPLPTHMDFGGLVGICELSGCFPAKVLRAKKGPREFWDLADHVHVEGPYCWVLEHVARFPGLIELRGQQGMFEVEEGIVRGTIEAMTAAGMITSEQAGRYLAKGDDR